MKYWIVGIVFIVLGLAEYAYVEYAPYSPEQRISKIRKTALGDYVMESWYQRRTEKAVQAGDPFAAQYLVGYGKKQGNEEMKERGMKALRASDTWTAKYFLYDLENDFSGVPLREQDEKSMALFVLFTNERLRPFGMSDNQYEKWKHGSNGPTEEIYKSAAAGDDFAQRIVALVEEMS